MQKVIYENQKLNTNNQKYKKKQVQMNKGTLIF